MILTSFIAWISVFFLSAATISDLKTSEIPEKTSLGFIALMLAFSLLYSLYTRNTTPFMTSLSLGFLYFLFAYVIYRLGQWGGGDVKLMGGIGCSLGLLDSLGFNWPNARIMPYPLSFIADMGFLALPYALLYSFYLTYKKPFVLTEFRSYLSDLRMITLVVLSTTPSLAAYFLGYKTLSIIYLTLPAVLFSIVYLKTVEKKALEKTIPISELREGDILAKEANACNITIKPEHMMDGLSSTQVEELKRLASEGKIPAQVSVKWGIKFAPILLLSFVASVLVGNVLEILFIYFLG